MLAGYGVFFGHAVPINTASNLKRKAPTTFRAELLAVVHVVSVSADHFIVCSDCKAVCDLCQRIFEEGSYDPKHNDADLLSCIHKVCQDCQISNIIKWMPAHLDEPSNQHKRQEDSPMEGRKIT